MRLAIREIAVVLPSIDLSCRDDQLLRSVVNIFEHERKFKYRQCLPQLRLGFEVQARHR